MQSTQPGMLDKFRASFFDKQQKQVNHIALITFWSQFSVYVLNTVLILFLTRPILTHGLGYSESRAYAFMGVTSAMGYLMPVIGGHMADSVLGIRRSIFIGSFLVALAYLLVMLSGYSIGSMGDSLFIGAFALIPVTNSLLMGTASAMVSKIYQHDEVKAKSGMLLYYMSINVGALLATILAPKLMESAYGPLTIFAVVFFGKSFAALNFSYRMNLYDDVISHLDKAKMTSSQILKLVSYIVTIYALTLVAYRNPHYSGLVIAMGCTIGIAWFLMRTLSLKGASRTKQLVAVLLIVEAIVFFVLYNQTNSTLILFAKAHSDLKMFGLSVESAHYQMVNPLVIILMSLFLPSFYERFRQFTIPFQFAVGTMLGGLALVCMWFACVMANHGVISGNYLVLTYFMMTIAELWVSAVGLSMIGLYCDRQMTAFAMGVWYLASSLSNIISSRLAEKVAATDEMHPHLLSDFKQYYLGLGLSAFALGVMMFMIAIMIKRTMEKRGIRMV